MKLWTNLFLLAHQVSSALSLRVIDNGLGLTVYGAEANMIDYAQLASDQKADLPSQVQYFFSFWKNCESQKIVQFTICSSATSDAFLTNLNFFQLFRQSGTPWVQLTRGPPGEFRLTVTKSW